MVVANLAWDLAVHSGGRFVLGLGTQVKAHNERRFSVPWVSPAPRLAEYVQALRAIWRCWETGGKLDFAGRFYNLSLMTPEFSPRAAGLPMVPVTIAAVGPEMQKAAARVADGVNLHGFATRKYIDELIQPALNAELTKSGRARENFEITGGGFIATGPDAAAVRAATEPVRRRIGFYGSTPAYHGVFELHGLGELGVKLHQASRRGEWDAMTAMVPDEVFYLFCVCATYDKLPEAVAERFGGVSDSIHIDFLPGDDARTRRKVIDGIKAIPSRFREFRTSWKA
jgi:probable F420-dependent oxidoreductase